MAWFYRASWVRNYVAYLLSVGTATMLKTAVAGILVAISAQLAHNFLCTLIDRFERESSSMMPSGMSSDEGPRPFRRAQSLPLRKRFSGLPPYALIVVFVLATLLFIYMLLSPYVPKGLRVRLLPIGSVESYPPYEQMVVISIVDASPADPAEIRMDSRKIPRKDLREYLLQKLNILPRRTVYVQAESTVDWGYVADVIDMVKGLNADVVLLTTTPARNPKCGWSKSPRDSHCRP